MLILANLVSLTDISVMITIQHTAVIIARAAYERGYRARLCRPVI